MTDRPVIVGRYTWAGGHDPALTIWLHDSPHHWDGDQLVLHDEGREVRPEPGYLIVLWSDGMANAASPRVAERVYQPQPRGERVPLDHLNSDQYDELCDDLDRYEIIQGGMNEHAIDLARRAGLAEAAVERVRAECGRIEAAVRANPTSPDFDGAYLAAIKHIRTALAEPTSVAPEDGTPNETAGSVATPGPAATQATEPTGWLLAGTRDLSIPQHLPKFTAVHVTPEMEREATERARQMAETHEQAEKSLVLAFGGQANDHPSRRAGLHDAIVGVLGQIPVIPPVAHRRAQADNVLALLYREWPWLRAEAEDAAPNAVDALYEQWVKAGPPPLGVPLARWWDKRLVELNNARNAAKET